MYSLTFYLYNFKWPWFVIFNIYFNIQFIYVNGEKELSEKLQIFFLTQQLLNTLNLNTILQILWKVVLEITSSYTIHKIISYKYY